MTYASNWLLNHLIKPVLRTLTFIFVLQFGAILLPHVPFLVYFYVQFYSVYKYFTPDYETALINGYKRPIIGLKLCRRCSRLRDWPTSCRMWHHDDPEHLEASASGGCWLCRSVHKEYLKSIADRDNPPIMGLPEDLPSRRLLLWFAERTKTSSGFLDHLRGRSYFGYVYGRHPRGLLQDLSSEASFNLVKEWVGRCDKQHRCYQGRQASLPTRVIDVSKEEPYLFISDGHHSPYITLSHCWGGEQPLVTTISTLKERTIEIPIESLPALYRDAVTVTRKLGINFLWIDSLCILQDCKDDWSKEAAKMGDVYRLSYLTLYALSSPNCNQGMLIQRQPISSHTPECFVNDIRGNRAREGVFKTAPLCQRAWALQERLLSPRLLYYSKEEMFWECLRCTAREGSYQIIPQTPTTYRYGNYEFSGVKIPLVKPLDENPSFPVSLPSDWQVIVAEYTRCRLSHPSDKLPALSGLASIFQRNTGYDYIAGLWKEDLVNGLLWYCSPELDQHQTTKHPTGPYRGPSWSWVSTDLAVQNKTLGDISRSSLYRTSDIEYINSDVQLAGHDPMGEIFSAVLTIKASFYQISYESQTGSRNCTIYDSGGKKFGRGILDASNEELGVRKQCAAVCVARKRQDFFRSETFVTYFLIVVSVPDGTDEGCWKRLGLAWTPRYIHPAPEMSVIRLI